MNTGPDNGSPVPSFDLDPDDISSVMGWAAFRPWPWHLAGFFATSLEARTLRDELPPGYFVRHGVRKLGTDSFTWYREDEDDDIDD